MRLAVQHLDEGKETSTDGYDNNYDRADESGNDDDNDDNNDDDGNCKNHASWRQWHIQRGGHLGHCPSPQLSSQPFWLKLI
jgi:hypothetical protein